MYEYNFLNAPARTHVHINNTYSNTICFNSVYINIISIMCIIIVEMKSCFHNFSILHKRLIIYLNLCKYKFYINFSIFINIHSQLHGQLHLLIFAFHLMFQY